MRQSNVPSRHQNRNEPASAMLLTVIPRSCCCAKRSLRCGIQRIHFEPRQLGQEKIMRGIALLIAFMISLSAPALAQKAEIEAINAKWIELFNKGDFSGIASLYSTDATALPPGSPMVHGRAAIEAMWKSMAEQASDPKLATIDVKPLGPAAA